jgi:hypothetical protein
VNAIKSGQPSLVTEQARRYVEIVRVFRQSH